jgi:hypothetical protein
MVFDGDLPTGDLHPISLRPCRAYQGNRMDKFRSASLATHYGVMQLMKDSHDNHTYSIKYNNSVGIYI